MNELPRGWTQATLAEVADVILGQSPPGSSYNSEGRGQPFFQGKAEFGDLAPTAVKWTTAGTKIAREGDVLLSVRAPVGPTNLAPFECVIGRGLAALRPTAVITLRFLLYTLRASESQLVERSTGTTFPAISGSIVRAHEIPVPPVAEQQRIVAVIEEQFSRLDAAEASLRRAQRNLERMRRRAIGDAVVGAWPTRNLGSVSRDQIYGTSAKASAHPDGVAVLRMGNIRDGSLHFGDLKYLPVNHPGVRKLLLEPGDLLFNRTNSPELVGKSAVFKGRSEPTIFASYLIRVRLTSDCDPDWAALVINGPIGRRYVAQVRTQQVGQANVNGTKLAAMPIPLPPLDEQRHIVAEVERQLSILDATKAAIDRAIERSKALRRAILERAFTGRLVPQDPTDEPASVLLEHIRAERAAAAPPRRAPSRRRATMAAQPSLPDVVSEATDE